MAVPFPHYDLSSLARTGGDSNPITLRIETGTTWKIPRSAERPEIGGAMELQTESEDRRVRKEAIRVQ